MLYCDEQGIVSLLFPKLFTRHERRGGHGQPLDVGGIWGNAS